MAAGPKYMTVREFARELGKRVERFNTSHEHRGIKTTPEKKRAECHVERELLDPAFVARALMRRQKDAVIHGNGVEFLGVRYFHSALIGRVGQPAELGWLDQHPEYVEVFVPDPRTGEMVWLCRATPVPEATKAMAGRVYRAREHAIESLSTVQAAAKRIAAARLAEMRATEPPVDEAPELHPAAPVRRARREATQRKATADRLTQLKQEGVFRDAQP